jgi:phage-related baseplate assembly protein
VASPTIEQLSEILSLDEAEEFLIEQLRKHEIDITAWGDGTAARDIAFACAAFFADRTRVTALIARGGYNQTAEGDWLTVFSDSHYDNQRLQAVRTEGYVQLTAGSDASLPIDIVAGEQVVVDRNTGLTYRIDSAGTIVDPLVAYQFLLKAEVAGADGNVGTQLATSTTSTLELQTPISGVTLTNFPNPPLTPVESWLTVEGANEESDLKLKVRNTSKWATLAFATGPRDAYIYWALLAAEAVTRVQVDDQDATGTGNVGVYLATVTGGADAASVTDVNDYVNGNAGLGIVRRVPIGSTVTIQSATDIPIAISVVIICEAAYQDGIAVAVTEAIEDYFALVPIGGTKVDPLDFGGFLLIGQVYRSAAAVPGVVNLTFSPAVNQSIPKGFVAIPQITIADVVPV